MCVFTEKDAAVDVARSGILPSLAQALRSKSKLSCQVALVVAEMAREGSPGLHPDPYPTYITPESLKLIPDFVCAVAAVREPCIDAGLVKVLVPHLNSNNQEMLLNTGRAIGRICFDNCE